MIPTRLCAIVLAAALLEPGAPHTVTVATVARDGRVHVSCTVDRRLLDDVDQAIDAGLTTTITYDVDLRRPVSVWLDRTIASVAVSAAVQHDTLTGRYQLTRTVDGRVENSLVSENRASVKGYLTAFTRLPLFSTAELEPNVEYEVRVRVRTRPRVTWFFWPWDRGTASGSVRFTFIP